MTAATVTLTTTASGSTTQLLPVFVEKGKHTSGFSSFTLLFSQAGNGNCLESPREHGAFQKWERAVSICRGA